ncbi:MAG: cytochrome c oxidase subunit 3 [Phycisphaeraceae bacterium]
MTLEHHSTNDARPPLGRQRHHVPPGTGTFGMTLFLLSLGILFSASMLLYVVFRLVTPGPPLGSIALPAGLWVSTALILVSSYVIHRALQNVRHERQTRFRNALTVTLLLAVAFLVVQTPSMTALLRNHRQANAQYQQEQVAYEDALDAQRAQQPPGTILDTADLPDRPVLPLFGLVMFLILVHALHVLGGLIPLAVVTVKAHAGRYDHEHHGPVKYLTMYWHFLDGVWIVMFVLFLVAA